MTRVTTVFPPTSETHIRACSHSLAQEQLSPFGGACVPGARQEASALLSKEACSCAHHHLAKTAISEPCPQPRGLIQSPKLHFQTKANTIGLKLVLRLDLTKRKGKESSRISLFPFFRQEKMTSGSQNVSFCKQASLDPASP